uniref:Uncharacterized protein n=1 Tax=Arundo donax TaxID=35708 RepID=A0A0A9G3E4_ARUDO
MWAVGKCGVSGGCGLLRLN